MKFYITRILGPLLKLKLTVQNQIPVITIGVYSILPNAAYASGYACQFNTAFSSIFNVIFNYTSVSGYTLYPEVRNHINLSVIGGARN